MARTQHRPDPDTRKAISDGVSVVSKALGQNYVSYHPLLVAVTGNVKSALFLSHAIAWSRHIAKTRPDREGWFWMRASEWQDGTGLSTREQGTARQILRALGVLQEKRIGVPAKMWYRLDLELLGQIVADATGRPFEAWSWDRQTMLKLLGQPIPCHRLLIRVANSVVGGLLISYLFSAVRKELVNGGDGDWMHIPVAITRDMIGISSKQQRLARERLRQAGLIEETFEQRVQPRLLTRLRLSVLAVQCARKSGEFHCLQDSRNLVCEMSQTRVAQNAYLELPKTQIKDGPMRESGVAQNADQGSRNGPLPIKKEYIQIQLPPPPSPPPRGEACASGRLGSGSGGEHLSEKQDKTVIVLPNNLHEGEAEAARALLVPLPMPLRQQVADEWAGLIDLSNRGIRPMHNRMGVLNTLSLRAQGLGNQPFVPTLAFSVAAARKRRLEIEAARSKESPDATRPTEEGIQRGRASLRQKMDQIWGGRSA